MTRTVAALGFVAVMGVTLAAQQSRPTFDVASIRRNVSNQGERISSLPGGGFVADNVRLLDLILFAYDLREPQLSGGPSWIRADRFDVSAKSSVDQKLMQVKASLQALLEDRFGLMIHAEQRETAVYALVTARSDGRLGPRIKRPETDCEPTAPRSPGGSPRSRMALLRAKETTTASCIPISLFTTTLSAQLGTEVTDKTGLSGLWDFEVTYADQSLVAGDAGGAVDPSAAPSIFTAVQEQLGLRLEPSRSPTKVMVIDTVSQPTDN